MLTEDQCCRFEAAITTFNAATELACNAPLMHRSALRPILPRLKAFNTGMEKFMHALEAKPQGVPFGKDECETIEKLSAAAEAVAAEVFKILLPRVSTPA